MINISKHINRENIFLKIKYKTKANILSQIVKNINFSTKKLNKRRLLNEIDKFENFKNNNLDTYIVFIPKLVKRLNDDLIISISTFPDGITYDRKIKSQIRLIILLISDLGNIRKFFRILSKFNFLLSDQLLQKNLINAESQEDIINLISSAENESSYKLGEKIKNLYLMQRYSHQMQTLKQQIPFHDDEIQKIIIQLIKQTEKKTENLKSLLDIKTFEDFERLKERYDGLALANSSEDICVACNTVIPVTITGEIKQGNHLVKCSNCGRFLYYAEFK